MIKNLTQAIISLHDIARFVERHYGESQTTKAIRDAAEKLNKIDKEK
jgi:hypothetical protein